MQQPPECYEPTHPPLCRIWKQLSEEMREDRREEAERRERILKTVGARPAGESERAALRRLAKAEDRSTFRRWQNRYREHGFDGLVDSRLPPRPEEVTSEAAREAMCTLRRADPEVSVATIIAHGAKFHDCQVGKSTVKEVLRAAGLARRGGPRSGDRHVGEVRLELAGMRLVEAADVQVGYVSALTKAIVAGVAEAKAPSSSELLPADTGNRDEFGRFESKYNERYRKKAGEALGPGFASVETTRAGKDPERFHLSHVSSEVIERKVWALMVSPLLGNGRWDGIRVARGDLLGELCGYAYMPSTLDLFTRELKFMGMASTWWEVHARIWFEQTKTWGELGGAAVLYIDGTTKGVWTELFSQSSKVSHLGRVMPSLEVVAFHSGYGVPLWQATYSGRAPLVREVPPLLDAFERMLPGAEVGRIVVLDAESNSIPFLKGLESGTPSRGWVTRLRPSWVAGKRIFNRTNYRPYRDGDRIRMGVADFKDPTGPAGAMFRMRVIEIERRSKGTVTYLGASEKLLEQDWSPSALGDLYFDRWPNQEADFRAVNQAVGSKDVHGYGKQLVDNVSVVTELDKLDNEIVQMQSTVDALEVETAAAEKKQNTEQTLLRRHERRMETVTRRIDSAIAGGTPVTPALQRLSTERRSIQKQIARGAARIARGQKIIERSSSRTEAAERGLAERRARHEKLDSRREIFRHDVELDSLFAVLKVALVLLVRFALKEYLGGSSMAPVTFLERLATLPGRVRMMPDIEIVTFDYNTRDPEVMALLATHREAINARRLRTRSGRVLRIEVDPAPSPRRPPPPKARANTIRRFAR